jgi:hypothetical protein
MKMTLTAVVFSKVVFRYRQQLCSARGITSMAKSSPTDPSIYLIVRYGRFVLNLEIARFGLRW